MKFFGEKVSGSPSKFIESTDDYWLRIIDPIDLEGRFIDGILDYELLSFEDLDELIKEIFPKKLPTGGDLDGYTLGIGYYVCRTLERNYRGKFFKTKIDIGFQITHPELKEPLLVYPYQWVHNRLTIRRMILRQWKSQLRLIKPRQVEYSHWLVDKRW